MILYLYSERSGPASFRSAEHNNNGDFTGRSQDLAAYRNDKVTLVEGEEEVLRRWATLLGMPFHTTAGTVYRLPHFIDPKNRRHVKWGDYLYSPYRLTWGEGEPGPRHISRAPGEKLWLDPDSSEINDRHRVVYWHTFVD